MSDVSLSDSPRLHPREDVEFARDIIHDQLLPPVPVQPFNEDGELKPEAREHLEYAVQKALEALKASGQDIPEDIITRAVVVNTTQRFVRAQEALDEFFDAKRMSPTARRIFALHEHDHPEDAMRFFERTTDLPSADVGAALCGHDTYTIAREILARTEIFPRLEVIDDDMPRLKTVIEQSNVDGRDYAIIMSKKIIAKDEEDSSLNYNMKRRKTYVISVDELQTRGLLSTAGSSDAVDVEALASLLQKAEITPDYLYPVIESVFIERAAAIRAIGQRDKLSIAFGRKVRTVLGADYL